MLRMLHPELGRKGLALVLTLGLALTGTGMAGAQDDGGANPPAKPAGLRVTTEAGSLEVSVSWRPVEGADSYWVRWRAHSAGNKLNEGVRVEASGAEVVVDGDGDQWMVQAVAVDGVGEWVVRVQACVGEVCGPPVAEAFTVEAEPVSEPESEPVSEPASLQKDVQESVPDPSGPVNRAPEVDEQAARYGSFTETGNAPRGTLVHRFFDGIFSDPDGDDLTFTAAVTAGRAELVDAVHVTADRWLLSVRVDADDDWAALSPIPADPLVTTVTLTATDPDGLSASLSTTWHTDWDAPDPEPVSEPVSEPAHALQDTGPPDTQLGVSVVASPASPLVAEPVTLSADISNAREGGVPSYSWELDFGGSWFAWGSGATFSYATNIAETQSFRVTVSYASGESATSAPLAVTWVQELPNRAPVVDGDAAAHDAFVNVRNAPRGTLVTKSFAGIFSDPDGDALSYATAVGGDGSRFAEAVQTSAERELVGVRMESSQDWGAVTPALPDPLVTTLTLTAFDPDGLSASVTGSFHTDWDSHPTITSAEAHISDGSLLLAFNQRVQVTPAPTAGQFTVHVTNADGTAATNAVEAVSVVGKLVFLDLAEKPAEGQTITLDYAHADATPLKRAAAGGDNAPSFTAQAVEVVEGLVTAQQQQGEATTLVSNIDADIETFTDLGGLSRATSFTTGSNSGGYTLTEVDISFRGTPSDDVDVRITTGAPTSGTLATLSAPESLTVTFPGRNLTFTAPEGTTLAADTTYTLVVEATTASTGQVNVTRTTEDEAGLSDWSITNGSYVKFHARTDWSTETPRQLMFSVKGSVLSSGPEPVRAVTTVDRAKVVITFNEPLNTGSTPAPGDFTVTVNGARRNVSTGGVAISGSAVTLTLESAVSSTDLVTVGYTKPAASPLQGSDNDDVDSFEDQPVDITLVSNRGQTNSATTLGAVNDYAQGFTTGSTASRYRLTAVDIDFASAPSALVLSVRSGLTGSSNGTLVGTLTNPDTLAAGANTFTASGDGLALDPSTQYFVVVDFSSLALGSLREADGGSEDSGSETGWSIANAHLSRDQSSTGWSSTPVKPLKLAVVGYGINDFDSDDDGLIEISSAAQLNAVRWDTDGDGAPASANESDYAAAFPGAVANMGCPATGCKGYEIGTGADGESAVTIDLGVAPYNTNPGWVPIPSFATALEGNGHTIDGLFISRTGSGTGLFASISSSGRVQNLKLTGVDVLSGGRGTASLAGENHGLIVAVSASGAVRGHLTLGACCFGGLVGSNDSNGRIVASHAAVSVSITGGGGGFSRGGLVGWNNARIVASYATGSVAGGANSRNIGGLVGINGGSGSIIASYSTGAVSGDGNLGGLVGFNQRTVTNSYYDSDTSGQSDTGKGTAKTTAELQTPAGYTGIYANWNVDVDGDSIPDDPWSFKSGFYPRVDYGRLSGHLPLSARAVTTVDRTKVVITFEEALNTGSTPAPGDFTVTVNGARRNVASGGVTVSASAVTLTLESAVAASTDLVTVGYTKPAANPLQHADNEDIDSFYNLAVHITLVSNLGQADGGSGNATVDYAQGFTTGAGDGYKLTGVQVQFVTLPANKGLSVSIRSGLTGSSNGTLVGTLANPDTLANGVNTFTASGDGLDLAPSTQYFVVVDFSGTGTATIQETNLDGEDSGSETGWSIANGYLFKSQSTATGWTTHTPSLKIAVAGYGLQDYDSDDDGLIEINTAAQLNALRWDTDGDGAPAAASQDDYAAAFFRAVPNMGCPAAGCTGYEIGTGADTETAITIDLGTAPYNTGAGWVPIGAFATVLEGNGHTIDGLTINRTAAGNGLFASISSSGRVQNLSLTGVNVSSSGGTTGSLAGQNDGWIGAVSAAGAVSGNITSAVRGFGGLVGSNGSTGTIVASHAAVSVNISGTGGGFSRGGLVGQNDGRIVASYATGSIQGTSISGTGGLVGSNSLTGVIVASYSTGWVRGGQPASHGGLVGSNQGTVTNSYYDSDTANHNDTGKGTGKTTSELKTPTGYTGIYQNWNLDLDGLLGADDPWTFGTATDYPTLDFTATLSAAVLADYDTDNDGLIEIASAAQLNALRWDADGDGAPAEASLADYLGAYPNAPTGMGCPTAGCTGYEIGAGAAGEAAVTIDLDVAPHNTGAGWVPIPSYSATFEGNGNLVRGLTMNRSVAKTGLFAEVAASGRVRNLRLTGVNITANQAVGAVAGVNRGRITSVYATGAITRRSDALPQHPTDIGGLVGLNETTGIIEASGSGVAVDTSQSVVNEFSDSVGGLVGRNGGAVRASYAFGDVTAGTNAIRVGAFAGRNWALGSSVTASYATGRVRVGDSTPHAQVSAFIGLNEGASNHNYFDSVTGRAATATGAAAKTTLELVEPTGYSGIYVNWNVDLDGDNIGDDPWDFGAADDYPVIDHGGLTAADQPQPPVRVIGLAVSSTVGPHDYYTEGEVIRVQVTFRKAVNADTHGGTPSVKLKFKPADTGVSAAYDSGTGTKTLTFAYTVLAADTSIIAQDNVSGVAVVADSLQFNGGTIDDAVTNTSLPDLSHPGLGHDTNHKVDGSRDITAPTVSSAETSADGAQIIVTFSEALKGHANTLDFRYSVDGVERVPGGLTTVLATGKVTLLGVVPAIEHGQTVRVKYTRPAGDNVLRDTSDNALESFGFQAVENKVPDTTPPRFTDAALNQDGDRITITFNENLDDTSVPANGDFSVTVNGVVRTNAVSGVAIDGATVVLTLSPALLPTDNVQLGYTPGANRLRDASPAQNEVTTLALQQVAKAQPVVTAIELLNTPADGQTFRVGEVIKVTVTFSEPVTASGRPLLSLFSDDGWMRVQARGQVSGPGPYTTMEFRHGVQAGDQAIDKLVFGTHAKHGGGITMAGGALTSSSGLAISPNVDPVTFDYRADGGPASRDAYPGRESYGPCRRDISLGPWQYNYHGSLGTKWGVGCDSRNVPGTYSKYFTFTIAEETRVRLHIESSTAFPRLILRDGGSYAGEAIETDEGFGSLHWARIDRVLPAGTYTLEATTPSGLSVSYFHLWYGIPRDLPDDDDPCVMMIDRGDTEAGQWSTLCHSTETLGAYAQYYRYTPTAPGLIELFLTSRGAAEELYLYEGDTLIKQNSSLNWKRNGTYAWIHYSDAKAGVPYTIEVTTDGAGETGNYLLALRGSSYYLWNDSDFKPEGAPVVMPQGQSCVQDLGTKNSGDLRGSGVWEWPCHSVEEPGGYARYFTFTLDEAKTIVVEVGSPHTWDAVLYLREGNKGSGNHIAFSDNGHGVRAVDARLEAELEAGTYTIEAAVDVPGNGDGGHFVLYVKEPPPPWTPPAHCVTDVAWGWNEIHDELTSGDGCQSYSHGGKNAHYYRFTLTQHAQVGLTMKSDAVNSFLLLHEGPGISGPPIGQNDNYQYENAGLSASLGPGTYIVEATTNNYDSHRKTGAFRFTAWIRD